MDRHFWGPEKTTTTTTTQNNGNNNSDDNNNINNNNNNNNNNKLSVCPCFYLSSSSETNGIDFQNIFSQYLFGKLFCASV